MEAHLLLLFYESKEGEFSITLLRWYRYKWYHRVNHLFLLEITNPCSHANPKKSHRVIM